MTSFFVTIAKWGGFNKTPTQTFEDYLINVKNFQAAEVEKQFRSKEDSKKIKLTSFDTLDVNFLYQLLPWLCDKIAKPGECQNLHDSSTLEYHLREIKNIRNSIMHEPYSAALDKYLVDKVETTALKLLDIAGAKYGKGTDEINAAKDETRKLISTIKNTVMTEEEKLHFYQQRLLYEGLPDLQKKTNDNQRSISPYFEHVKSFCSLQLTRKEYGVESTISCEDIFTHAKEKGTQVLIIEGQSGSGKTHLLKEVQADILRETKKIFKGSDEFHAPLLFECRKRACETISEFASEEFPCLGATSTEKGLTEKVLSGMKSILLIDGIDETNESSEKMLENIFAFLKNNSEIFCIFTSRPFAAEQFQEKLKKEGFSRFQALALKKLTSEKEQMAFLYKSCEKGKDISSAYEDTSLNLQSPLLLAIYGHLWLKEPESLKSCKNKDQIMKAWIDCGLRVARQRLEQRKVVDCEDIAKNILESISLVSFSCLLKGQLEIKVNEIKWLKEEIRKEFTGISVNMDPHEILSCFFVGSSDSKNDEIHIFAHTCQQEILSSLYVAGQMHERGKKFREIFSEAIEYDRPSRSPMPSVKNYDFRRFFNK